MVESALGNSTSGPGLELCDPERPQDTEVHRIPVLPLNKPPFTLKDIRNAIPEHCFKRSYVTSFAYLFSNLFLCYLVSFVTPVIRALPWPLAMVAWPLYWFVQGCCMTGLWVIGHECGHGGFADSQAVNDLIGLLVHTSLLVPYHAWAYTHSQHHSNCGSMENDEVFVPEVENESLELDVDNPIKFTAPMRFLQIIRFLFAGWPAYLLIHVTGPKKYDGQWTNHFLPSSPCFPKHKRTEVIVSDIALFGFCFFIYTLAQQHGWVWILQEYICPLLVTNMWLVVITQLQHTSLLLPHYRGSEWTWLRGALSTTDRSFGVILDTLFHHIQDTHVCHHLFSNMPFYHAQEATVHIKRVIGKYHVVDHTPIWQAVWDTYRDCIYVKKEGGVLFFHGHPTMSVKFEDYYNLSPEDRAFLKENAKSKTKSE